MNLIVIPGCEALDNEWVENIKAKFSDKYDKIVFYDFNTCQNKTFCEGVNIDSELQGVCELVSDLEGDYVILSRRVGSMVALKGIFEKKLNPVKCVFLGLPVMWARFNNLKVDEWIKDFSISTLFIERKTDSMFYFSDIDNFLKKNNAQNYKVIEVESLDWGYNKAEAYREYVLEYLNMN